MEKKKIMKPDKNYHRLTDKDKDAILKLIVCGLPTDEIADIMHCSKSTVGYHKQAHTACINKDWSTLQKLSINHRSIVDWAMKVTGTDKVFEESFPKQPEVEAPKPEPAPETISKEDFASLRNTLQDICYLLTEIRDMLK